MTGQCTQCEEEVPFLVEVRKASMGTEAWWLCADCAPGEAEAMLVRYHAALKYIADREWAADTAAIEHRKYVREFIEVAKVALDPARPRMCVGEGS